MAPMGGKYEGMDVECIVYGFGDERDLEEESMCIYWVSSVAG